MKSGQISYEKAQVEAKPLLSKLNERGRKIAKEFGKNYSNITFTGFMR